MIGPCPVCGAPGGFHEDFDHALRVTVAGPQVPAVSAKEARRVTAKRNHAAHVLGVFYGDDWATHDPDWWEDMVARMAEDDRHPVWAQAREHAARLAASWDGD